MLKCDLTLHILLLIVNHDSVEVVVKSSTDIQQRVGFFLTTTFFFMS
jgi:hypothetical protein